MEIVQESTWMDMVKYQMCALKEKSEIVFRILDRRFLYSQMIVQMTLIPV